MASIGVEWITNWRVILSPHMPDRPAPDYEKEFIIQLQRNDREVIDLLERNDPGMLKKISTLFYAAQFPFGRSRQKDQE